LSHSLINTNIITENSQSITDWRWVYVLSLQCDIKCWATDETSSDSITTSETPNTACNLSHDDRQCHLEQFAKQHHSVMSYWTHNRLLETNLYRQSTALVLTTHN